MPDAKGKTDKAEKKARGPVNYMAFVEGEGGFWWLAAADREATSAFALRKELIAELEYEGSVPDRVRIVIIQSSLAHVVEHTREVVQTDKFKATKLASDDAQITAPPPLPPADTNEGVAARAAASPAPAGAIVSAGDAALAAAVAAEGAGRAAAVMPVDPDDDEEARNPDIDPATGLSRRSADQARPDDEGRTVFPIPEDQL